MPSDKILHLLRCPVVALHEVTHHVNGQGEDDGAVLLGRDAGQRLQVPEERYWRLEPGFRVPLCCNEFNSYKGKYLKSRE